MKLSDFNYNLPGSLIADNPERRRDQSRLLVLGRTNDDLLHRHFYDLPEFLNSGDVLVLNNSKVFPARLTGRKERTGGRVEVLLSKEIESGLWEVIGKGLVTGKRIIFDNSSLRAVTIEAKNGLVQVRFSMSGNRLFDEIEKIGTIPLPPYITQKRKQLMRESYSESDKASYQTIYAKQIGSIAAPTAGLHFTPELINQLNNKGVQILEVTLHVGLGTFAEIKTEEVEDHQIHSERYSVSGDTIEKIIKAKQEGHRVIAVGTTTTRVIEHIFSVNSGLPHVPCSMFHDQNGWTNIFIYPGYKFKCIDGLITNFHTPKSSLLLLVSALVGKDKILAAYQEAIKQKYRFYSYGDAMLII